MKLGKRGLSKSPINGRKAPEAGFQAWVGKRALRVPPLLGLNGPMGIHPTAGLVGHTSTPRKDKGLYSLLNGRSAPEGRRNGQSLSLTFLRFVFRGAFRGRLHSKSRPRKVPRSHGFISSDTIFVGIATGPHIADTAKQFSGYFHNSHIWRHFFFVDQLGVIQA